MRLYQSNGYANMRDIILNSETPFVLCIGGRGTGKTYTSILTLLEEKIPFMFVFVQIGSSSAGVQLVQSTAA